LRRLPRRQGWSERLGLSLFLYCVGIQYGYDWYRGLTSRAGLVANVAGVFSD
jgi:uncharacterized transporter YbjL